MESLTGDSRLAGLRLVGSVWKILSRRRRTQSIVLVGFQAISAALEVISLGALVPFVALLADPDGAMEDSRVLTIADFLRIDSADRLVTVLALFFAAVVLLAGAARLACHWVNTRLSQSIANDLTTGAYERLLHRSYESHVQMRSGEAMSLVLTKVELVAVAVVQPLQTLGGAALTIIMLVAALVTLSPVGATVVIAAVGTIYWATGAVVRRRLNRNSVVVATTRTDQVRAIEDGLGGIRDILLDGSQQVFVERFRLADRRQRRVAGTNLIIGSAPRFALESASLLLVALAALWLGSEEAGFTEALPVLGAMALGGLRLIPSLQLAFNAWTLLEGSRAVVEEAMVILREPDSKTHALRPLSMEEGVRFEDVSYSYGGQAEVALRGVDLVIPRGSRIGITGPTGGGKSTFLDLLMGLLEPTGGSIQVDGVPLAGVSRHRWMRSVAHVPQSVFLTDDTIRANIAFGVNRADIDENRILEAARLAELAEFIDARPGGLDEIVGADGIRLSGGQRQRIGIARALYRQAPVLILDEATSALDEDTERRVIDGIRSLDYSVTIVQVTHRLATVADCDLVVEMVDGRMK